MTLNLGGFFNAFRIFTRPSLFVPHLTVGTFNDLPVPLGPALAAAAASSSSSSSSLSSSSSSSSSSAANTRDSSEKTTQEVDIRAVVLDKDDCFALPDSLEVYPAYVKKLSALRASTPTILIVSNTAGTASHDPDDSLALALESATGLPVLRHSAPKPASSCARDVLAWFAARPHTRVTNPAQVVVVGDRLATDVALAHEMGAWAVWLREGVVPVGDKSVFSRVERTVLPWLVARGVRPPQPDSNPFA